jgi:hypothetical protein
MNKGRLVWGIICLALAGLLAVLNVALPDEEVIFMVGDANMPYLPSIILGIVGIVLLTAVRSGTKKAIQEKKSTAENEEKTALNKRLETIGWGCFLLMLGGFIFVPYTMVSKGVWSIGVGVIMLGLNIARYFYGIRLSSFTTFLGVISLIVGIAQLLGAHALEGAALFIVLGAYLILKPWFDKRRLFGKAEESQ